MSTLTAERKAPTTEHRVILENVRRQMLTFGNQIHEYFEHIQADVENYKFTVEKHGEGVEVEVELKAYIHPKPNEAAKIIPK